MPYVEAPLVDVGMESDIGNPLTIPSLQWFIDADVPGSVTDAGGGAVSQWNDLSVNANHLVQATATNRPTTGTVNLNGRNVIDFDGTDNYMDGSAFSAVVSTKAITFFGVVKWDATGTGKAVMHAMRSGGGVSLNQIQFEINGTDQQFTVGNGAAGFNVANFNERVFANASKTEWHRYMFTMSSADTWHAYLDGVEVGTSNGAGGGTMTAANFLSSDSSAWKPTVGRRPDPFYFDGKVATLGLFSEVLGASARFALDRWLATRWRFG